MPLVSAAGTAENSLWQQPRCLQHTREAGLFEQAPFPLRENTSLKLLGMGGGWREKEQLPGENRDLCARSLLGGGGNTHTKTPPLFFLFEKYMFCGNKDSLSLLQAVRTSRISMVRHMWPFQLREFLVCRCTETGRGRCRESPANPKTVDV